MSNNGYAGNTNSLHLEDISSVAGPRRGSADAWDEPLGRHVGVTVAHCQLGDRSSRLVPLNRRSGDLGVPINLAEFSMMYRGNPGAARIAPRCVC